MKTLYCNLCSILAAGKNARKLKNLSFLNLQTNKLQAEVEKNNTGWYLSPSYQFFPERITLHSMQYFCTILCHE